MLDSKYTMRRNGGQPVAPEKKWEAYRRHSAMRGLLISRCMEAAKAMGDVRNLEGVFALTADLHLQAQVDRLAENAKMLLGRVNLSLQSH